VGKRYTKSSNQESDFEQVLNPYLLAKVTAERQFHWEELQLRLKFSADNLFNQNYQSILWRPMPGRYYTVSLAFKFNSTK
jgi:iron complex outermembrane receptor protein